MAENWGLRETLRVCANGLGFEGFSVFSYERFGIRRCKIWGSRFSG